MLSWRVVPGRGSTFTVRNELNSAAAAEGGTGTARSGQAECCGAKDLARSLTTRLRTETETGRERERERERDRQTGRQTVSE